MALVLITTDVFFRYSGNMRELGQSIDDIANFIWDNVSDEFFVLGFLCTSRSYLSTRFIPVRLTCLVALVPFVVNNCNSQSGKLRLARSDLCCC